MPAEAGVSSPDKEASSWILAGSSCWFVLVAIWAMEVGGAAAKWVSIWAPAPLVDSRLVRVFSQPQPRDSALQRGEKWCEPVPPEVGRRRRWPGVSTAGTDRCEGSVTTPCNVQDARAPTQARRRDGGKGNTTARGGCGHGLLKDQRWGSDADHLAPLDKNGLVL